MRAFQYIAFSNYLINYDEIKYIYLPMIKLTHEEIYTPTNSKILPNQELLTIDYCSKINKL